MACQQEQVTWHLLVVVEERNLYQLQLLLLLLSKLELLWVEEAVVPFRRSKVDFQSLQSLHGRRLEAHRVSLRSTLRAPSLILLRKVTVSIQSHPIYRQSSGAFPLPPVKTYLGTRKCL